MSNPQVYRRNHYVPKWYQRRFLLQSAESSEFYYLDLKPSLAHTDRSGRTYYHHSCRKRGIHKSFRQRDLYTQFFGDKAVTEIESDFFGKVDRFGPQVLDRIEKFDHLKHSIDKQTFNMLLITMSLQRLRTPKGLSWLESILDLHDINQLLSRMTYLRSIFAAIWAESVWQIASAEDSETKFILSDHPVTVYNRKCGPRHRYCKKYADPDIRLAGSHTIYPLSKDKILILTNISWVRGPYQNPLTLRPNPNLLRPALANTTEIQINRRLTEREVREINFIIKYRAYQYVAAPVREWLHPESFISRSDWASFGNGYLLMPDPREVSYGGETYIGYQDGSTEAFDRYGRQPDDREFGSDPKRKVKYNTLYRFQGEFAKIFGRKKRGLTLDDMMSGSTEYSEDQHKYYIDKLKSD